MRIACIHVPQLSLQCATRLDPSLKGAAVAVVGGGGEPGRGPESRALHAPVVLACSRAAWALGVRLGMTATAARGLSPQLTVVQAEATIERETIRAICDAVLAISPMVDAGGRIGPGGAHLAVYCEVPAKTRGQSFGDKLLELVDELGLTARVGIADDRFTAWVAASHGTAHASGSDPAKVAASHGSAHASGSDPAKPNASAADDDAARRDDGASRRDERARRHDDHERGVISVPRGGSAAFLAPRPLSLLAIPPEVQHMLEALGVRTLGEFAALPAPSVARPFEADYQGLARGEAGATLRPYAPEAPIREDIVISAGVLEAPGSLSAPAAVALLARRISLRLVGRDRNAARLEVTAMTQPGDARELPIALATPTNDPSDLARVLSPALETPSAGAWRLRVVIAGEAIVGEAAHEAAPTIYAAPSEPAAVRPNAGGWVRVSDGRELVRDDSRPYEPKVVDPLAVVLSTSGTLFSLSPPTLRSERRDAHRRTSRGKQRRARPASVAQAKLFDRRS